MKAALKKAEDSLVTQLGRGASMGMSADAGAAARRREAGH